MWPRFTSHGYSTAFVPLLLFCLFLSIKISCHFKSWKLELWPQPFNTVTWYDLLLRGEQINEFAPMTETELRLKLQWLSAWASCARAGWAGYLLSAITHYSIYKTLTLGLFSIYNRKLLYIRYCFEKFPKIIYPFLEGIFPYYCNQNFRKFIPLPIFSKTQR